MKTETRRREIIATRQNVGDFYKRHPYPPPVDQLASDREGWDDWRRRADACLLWPTEPYRDDRSILVAGCGTSQAAKYAMRWPNAKVTGIDLSAESIASTQKLKQRYSLDNLRLLQLPVERAAVLGEAFEHVVCTGVLHHLPDPEAGLPAGRRRPRGSGRSGWRAKPDGAVAGRGRRRHAACPLRRDRPDAEGGARGGDRCDRDFHDQAGHFLSDRQEQARAARILRLGFLANFISKPVLLGFQAGAKVAAIEVAVTPGCAAVTAATWLAVSMMIEEVVVTLRGRELPRSDGIAATRTCCANRSSC